MTMACKETFMDLVVVDLWIKMESYRHQLCVGCFNVKVELYRLTLEFHF